MNLRIWQKILIADFGVTPYIPALNDGAYGASGKIAAWFREYSDGN